MINKEFNSIIELLEAFPTEQSCIDYFEKLRWNGNVVSPFDSTSKVYKCKDNRYHCNNTRKYFTVKTKTLYDNTKVSLKKWFLAVWLVTSHKKGISSLQLSRDLNVTQKTGWFMLQRIRNCFGCENESELKNEVEMDETFVGGKNRNRHRDKKVEKCQGRSFKDKVPIYGAIERGGKVIAKVVNDTSYKSIAPIVFKHVDKKAMIFTDEWVAYDKIGKLYNRIFVDHSKGQYADRESNATTNRMENLWSILKRGIIGIYHFISKKHLQKYVDEFVFRRNTIEYTESSRFNSLLCNSEKRLTYKQLIYGK